MMGASLVSASSQYDAGGWHAIHLTDGFKIPDIDIPCQGIVDGDQKTFMQEVVEASRTLPVMVDFWATWCGPCKQLTPVLEKAVKAAKGKVKLAKMNIDEHPAIPGQLGIQSIPAVIAFVNGQPADGFMGALPETQIVAFLERLTKDRIGGEAKDLLNTADAALAAGDAAGVCDGIHFGENTKAALITRGLAEITRLGCALGAHPVVVWRASGAGPSGDAIGAGQPAPAQRAGGE